MGHLEVAYACGHTGTEYFRGDKVDYDYYRRHRFCLDCYKEALAKSKIKEAEKEKLRKIFNQKTAILLIDIYRETDLAKDKRLGEIETWVKSDTCEIIRDDWGNYSWEWDRKELSANSRLPAMLKQLYYEYKVATGYYTDNPTGYYGVEKTAAIAEVIDHKPKQPDCLKPINDGARWNGKVYANCIYLDGEKVILTPAEKKELVKYITDKAKWLEDLAAAKRTGNTVLFIAPPLATETPSEAPAVTPPSVTPPQEVYDKQYTFDLPQEVYDKQYTFDFF
jgi:hypothetical protein